MRERVRRAGLLALLLVLGWSASPAAQTGVLRVPLLSAATTGTSVAVDVSGYRDLTLYLKTNGSPGAGTLVIEEADWNGSDPAHEAPTALTWSAITTITITTGVGNSSQAAYHAAAGAYHFLRVRVGSTVTVATLDVVLYAQ